MNEQEIKTYITEQRALKVSYAAIAQALNDRGIPTPTGKGKWSKSAVHGIANEGKPTRAEIMSRSRRDCRSIGLESIDVLLWQPVN